jgi:hypothetical protein
MDNQIKYLVLAQEGNHEYTVVVDKLSESITQYSLYTSNNSIWTDDYKNKMVMSITDNGNGVKFNQKCQTVEYDELLYMKLLLGIHGKDYDDKFRIIEEKFVSEI